MKQADLFPSQSKPREGYPVSPLVDVTAKKSGNNTESKRANVRAARSKNNRRALIYIWFRKNGPAIAEDVLKAFPEWRYSTVTARISELRRDGFLEQIGERKTTYSNSPAALLRVTSMEYPP